MTRITHLGRSTAHPRRGRWTFPTRRDRGFHDAPYASNMARSNITTILCKDRAMQSTDVNVLSVASERAQGLDIVPGRIPAIATATTHRGRAIGADDRAALHITPRS